jgi:paraquat-inducible protein A
MKKGFSRRWRAMVPWPRPPGGRRHAACHFCDTLHEAFPVEEGSAARCVRCGALLYQNRPASLARASAFSLAALLLMVLVHVFPFLTMDAASMRRNLTLVGAATALIEEDAPILGASVILFTAITPVMLAGGMIYVCLPLLFGLTAPGSFEVFLLGVLVSLLKLAKVADVHFGLGFWAFAGVMLCMAAAVAGIDREELWDRLEVARG